MPTRTRFIQGLVLAGGGTLLASSAVVPAAVVADASNSESTVTQAGHGLDWEKAPAPLPKRPPNG